MKQAELFGEHLPLLKEVMKQVPPDKDVQIGRGIKIEDVEASEARLQTADRRYLKDLLKKLDINAHFAHGNATTPARSVELVAQQGYDINEEVLPTVLMVQALTGPAQARLLFPATYPVLEDSLRAQGIEMAQSVELVAPHARTV